MPFQPPVPPFGASAGANSTDIRSRRVEFVSSVLETVPLLLPHASTPLATKLLSLLSDRKKIHVHQPKQGVEPGIMSAEKCDYAQTIKIAPIYKEDMAGPAGPWLKRVHSKHMQACVMDELKGILVFVAVDLPFTLPVEYAGYLVHELVHLFHIPTQGKVPRTDEQVLTEEVLAFTLQTDLIAGYGGDPYLEAVLLAKAFIAANLTVENGVTMPPKRGLVDNDPRYYELLGRAFGQPNAHEDLNDMRLCTLWTGAIYSVFDELYGEESFTYKLRFMERAYSLSSL